MLPFTLTGPSSMFSPILAEIETFTGQLGDAHEIMRFLLTQVEFMT